MEVHLDRSNFWHLVLLRPLAVSYSRHLVAGGALMKVLEMAEIERAPDLLAQSVVDRMALIGQRASCAADVAKVLRTDCDQLGEVPVARVVLPYWGTD